MKKRFSLLLALVLVFTASLTACGGGSDSEQVKVAKDFNACISEMKADDIEKLCTEEFAPEASMVVGMMAVMGAADEEFVYEASDYKVEEEKEDTAVVTFTLKAKMAGEENEGPAKMMLKKVDGKWLVNGME